MSASRRISILAAAGCALFAGVIGAVGGWLVGLGALEAIAESFTDSDSGNAIEGLSQGLTIAELEKTVVLGALSVTPLRVKELRMPEFDGTSIGGRALGLWCRVENQSEVEVTMPSPHSSSWGLSGSDLRDEFANQMGWRSFGGDDDEDLTLKPGGVA